MSTVQDIVGAVFEALPDDMIGGITFTRTTGGTYDATTRTRTGGTTTVSPSARGVLTLPYTPATESFESSLNIRSQYYDLDVVAEDLSGYVPMVGDLVAIAGDTQTYTVKGIGRASPSGVPADTGMFSCTVSK